MQMETYVWMYQNIMGIETYVDLYPPSIWQLISWKKKNKAVVPRRTFPKWKKSSTFSLSIFKIYTI
jgi:hypothetical protein